jgi:hypothetical protein
MVIEHGRGREKRLNEEGGNCPLLCILLPVFIHTFLWCHDHLQLMLKFQSPIHSVVIPRDMNKKYADWMPFCRALVVG